MDERLVVVNAEPGYADTIVAMAEQAGVLDCTVLPAAGEPPCESIHLLVSASHRQKVLDTLQSILGSSGDWRIAILPVEATIPRVVEQEQDEAAKSEAEKAAGESREELYNDVARNARLDGSFLVFVTLSTVVAAIGLIENNVAVVIGAMVIAPLLGPNLAFCLGVALGDRSLMGKAALTNAVGVTLTLAICILIGLVWPIDMASEELLARTVVGFDSIALALASGAAAALSLVTGLSAALVGVMVAVALMPPAAVVGLMIGAGEWHLAVGAATLLAVNVVCLNLSSQVTFVARGVTPRTRFEKEAARRAVWINAVVWLLLLAALAALLFSHAIEVPEAF